MCLCVGAHMPLCACGGQRTIYRSQISLYHVALGDCLLLTFMCSWGYQRVSRSAVTILRNLRSNVGKQAACPMLPIFLPASGFQKFCMRVLYDPLCVPSPSLWLPCSVILLPLGVCGAAGTGSLTESRLASMKPQWFFRLCPHSTRVTNMRTTTCGVFQGFEDLNLCPHACTANNLTSIESSLNLWLLFCELLSPSPTCLFHLFPPAKWLLSFSLKGI